MELTTLTKPSSQELIDDLVALLDKAVQDVLAIPPPHSTQAAKAFVNVLQTGYGGQEVYMPARRDPTRDDRLREMAKTKSRQEVMAHFGVSQSTFYEVVGTRKKAAADAGDQR